MLDRWKKKINNFLFVNAEEEDESPGAARHSNQDIETKMMYQYPEKKPCRFPVIPDQSSEKEDSEMPAYKRKKDNNVDVTEKTYYQTQKEPPIEKADKSYTGESFTPSDVPSPIYGFQGRKKDNEVEDIPAFQRREEVEEEPVAVEGQESAVKQAPVMVEEPAEEQEPAFEQARVKAEESAGKQEPIDISDSETDQEKENDSHATNDNPINKHISGDDAGDMTQTREASKPENKKPGKKESKTKKREQSGSQPPPFNVMMSANDKRKQMLNQKPATQPAKQQNTGVRKTIPYHLLEDPVQKSSQDDEWMKSQQELLEKTLKHFNVRAKVVNTTQGPSVTRFEVQPELGVKVSKIKNLSDDLKLNMAARDIRIEAPIPGKNTIGIEIPNQHAQMVGLQEIFDTERFQKSKSPLTVGLGLSIEGDPQITDIQKMPHGLIAGATGSGKSVCINTILISLLYKADYQEVKFLMIDPKMVELAPFNGIPHLISPVITDVKAATAALKWAVGEMDDRYDAFVKEGVRDVERFNQKMVRENRSEEKMPFIVIVIDELADLMMVSPQDVEDAISRIAQKARACGIHLLLATQRPSVDVITGLIKANIPTRIAFSVSSQVDSRTIIDTGGAEKLLGKGDMLFTENGAGKSIRLQGAFVSDEEIERVTDYARSIAEPDYQFEQEQLLEQISKDDHEDELLDHAIEFVVEQNNASTSMIQRHFKIGYNRAARLMDAMEDKGIIAQQNGSKPRDVLISAAQLEN